MIKLENLSKQFKSYDKEPGLSGAIKGLFSRKVVVKKAISGISLDVPDGEIIGYIGANGAGKSTTIKIMTGILKPTSGMCEVNGLVPFSSRREHTKNIGVVFGQRTQLWWDLPLRDSFSVLKEVYEISDGDFKARLKYLSDLFGLDELMGSAVRTLSLGQRMKADISASVLHMPKVLFLDEPTIGLDVLAKENMRSCVRDIHEKYGTTVVLTTHDMEDIQELCKRIAIIDNGVLIYDGSLEHIQNEYGFMKTLSVDADLGEDLPGFLAELKGLGQEFKYGRKEGRTEISFDSRAISALDLIAVVMANAKIYDIALKDTQLADIVKKIYRKKGL
jgi:ABC-2 type transport system ATP-binding protein